MKLYNWVSISCFLFILMGGYFNQKDSISLDENTPVETVLKKMGAKAMPHQTILIKGASAEKGEELVKYGITKSRTGRKTKKQSKHFVCTSCHNIEKEDPDLRFSDPQKRLDYVIQKGLPFLQGTTLYGAVNRSSFYNGDYSKKYGDLVDKARNNIREAIQLCAVECAQGRRLKDWEVESILAYMWTLELKVGDLNLSKDEMGRVESAMRQKGGDKEGIEFIRSRFLAGSPATFIGPPENRIKGNGLTGNPENGHNIYTHSCLHCHSEQRYSFFDLDESKLSLNFLEKHFPKYTRQSVYQVGRYGTPPLGGKRAYMPQYTAEKMSRQMMADLRAYVEQN